MTGIDRIKSKIIEDAAALAAQAEEQARAEAEEIMKQASDAAGKNKSELLEQARYDSAGQRKRLLAQAGLEGRKEILRTKQNLIEEAFQIAMEKLCGLSDREYQKLLEDMIVGAAVKEGGKGSEGKAGGEILLSARDLKRMDGSFLVNINQRLNTSGRGGVLTLSGQPVDTAGGFILKNGDTEINSTFEIVFGTLRTELESDIVRILFEN